MAIVIGGNTMPDDLAKRGEYEYPEYEVLGYTGDDEDVTSRYQSAAFIYPQGLSKTHWEWWTQTVLSGAHSRTFEGQTITLKDAEGVEQTYSRCVVHRPPRAKVRRNYRYENVTIRITGIDT